MNQIFSKGEKVISLTNPKDFRSQPRIKGNLYIVKDVMYCSKCGEQKINISGKISTDHLSKSQLTCNKCNNSLNPEGLWWTKSSLFIRPEELEEAIELFAKKEDYETCDVLVKFKEENLVEKII